MNRIHCDGGCGHTWPQAPGEPVPPPLVELEIHRPAGTGMSDSEIQDWHRIAGTGDRLHFCLPCALDALVALAGVAAPTMRYLHPEPVTAGWQPPQPRSWGTAPHPPSWRQVDPPSEYEPAVNPGPSTRLVAP